MNISTCNINFKKFNHAGFKVELKKLENREKKINHQTNLLKILNLAIKPTRKLCKSL
jgi:hypothetical protein